MIRTVEFLEVRHNVFIIKDSTNLAFIYAAIKQTTSSCETYNARRTLRGDKMFSFLTGSLLNFRF